MLKLRSTGAPVKRVASQLGITTHAVNKYSTTAYRKLGVTNIGTAVVAARRLDLIPAVAPTAGQGRTSRSSTASPAGIYAKDLAGRYTLCNRAAAARFGLSAAEVLGRTAEDIMDLETSKLVRAADERALTDSKAENRLVIGAHTYLDRKSALYGDDGKVSGVCGVAVDVTDAPGAGQQYAQVLDVISTLVRTTDPTFPGVASFLDAQIRELWRDVGAGAVDLARIQEHFVRTGTNRYEARAMLEFLVNSRNADPGPATWNAAVREVADVLQSSAAKVYMWSLTCTSTREPSSRAVKG